MECVLQWLDGFLSRPFCGYDGSYGDWSSEEEREIERERAITYYNTFNIRSGYEIYYIHVMGVLSCQCNGYLYISAFPYGIVVKYL